MIYGSIGTVGAGLVAVVAALNKFKVINIPFRRNNGNNHNNQFSGMSVSDIEKRCRDIHGKVDVHLTEIDKDSSEQKSDIKHMEKRLDKGEERFSVIQLSLAAIDTKVSVIDTKFEMREKDLSEVLREATDLIKQTLPKLG